MMIRYVTDYIYKQMKESAQKRTRRHFIDEKSISHHLYCSICSEVFEEPQRLPCGHTFCYVCIIRWTSYSKNCPLCKSSLIKRPLERDLIASKIVDDLRVKCCHSECPWEGVYSVLKKHQRKCEFKKKQQNLRIDQVSAVNISDTDEQEEVVIMAKNKK